MSHIRFDILTIFPDFFTSPFSVGVLKRAVDAGLIEIHTHNIRDYATDKHNSVDDKPYGGGAGMVFKPEPLGRAIEAAKSLSPHSQVILTSPQGEKLNDKIVRELSEAENLIIICGRYEGVDDRIRQLYVDREISVGDYIITGGEYAAAVIVDAVSRYVPDVLGNVESPYSDSFKTGLLEHPHYTRPKKYQGLTVPDVLMSGNHKEIEGWRHNESLKRTFHLRPDLLSDYDYTPADDEYINRLKKESPFKYRVYVALLHFPVYNKELKIIKTAITNLDTHDIARAAKTYGVRNYYIVHPIEEQRALAQRVIDHWRKGPGQTLNPNRKEALELVRISKTLEEVIDEIETLEGARPKLVVTDARVRENMIGYRELREKIFSANEPYLILFGTGWGIINELIEEADYALKPIRGLTDYNHLSVRSAAAVIMDRLLSE